MELRWESVSGGRQQRLRCNVARCSVDGIDETPAWRLCAQAVAAGVGCKRYADAIHHGHRFEPVPVLCPHQLEAARRAKYRSRGGTLYAGHIRQPTGQPPGC
jgi:hypothetical protein